MKRNDIGIWKELIDAARKVQNKREVSPFIEAGGVAAAILTDAGNIYVGVCIDTACTLGMCAEINAIANMITSGESKIKKLVAFRKRDIPQNRSLRFRPLRGML